MDDSLNQNEKQEIKAFVGMPQDPLKSKEKLSKNKKIILLISIIVILLAIGLYFLISYLKEKNSQEKYNKFISEEIERINETSKNPNTDPAFINTFINEINEKSKVDLGQDNLNEE